MFTTDFPPLYITNLIILRNLYGPFMDEQYRLVNVSKFVLWISNTVALI